jgi:hypothetical protein
MKKYNIPFILFLIFVFYGNVMGQVRLKERYFYFGFGTSVSTYTGGDFGNRFAMRITYPQNDYNNNFYYNRYNYNDYYNDNTSMNPLQADMTFGFKPSKHMAIELNTGIIWHGYGHPDPQYQYGTYGNSDYTDRYDNSTLLAVPIMATVKFYPFASMRVPLYLLAGYGVQYTSEKLDRVREFYSYNSYYGNYNNSYSYPIAEYSDARWLQGVRTGMGYSFNLSDMLIGDVELSYSNFFSEAWQDSPLAMNRTKNIGNISLGTHVYFGF